MLTQSSSVKGNNKNNNNIIRYNKSKQRHQFRIQTFRIKGRVDSSTAGNSLNSLLPP